MKYFVLYFAVSVKCFFLCTTNSSLKNYNHNSANISRYLQYIGISHGFMSWYSSDFLMKHILFKLVTLLIPLSLIKV
jgi:hypothetical protein